MVDSADPGWILNCGLFPREVGRVLPIFSQPMPLVFTGCFLLVELQDLKQGSGLAWTEKYDLHVDLVTRGLDL